MMQLFLALRAVLCALLVSLLCTAASAQQQIGQYPDQPVIVDKGSLYCKTPELVKLLLDMVRRTYTEGYPPIPINGCGRISAEFRVSLKYVQTYNSGLTEADILEVRIYREFTLEDQESPNSFYIVGEERLVWAIL
jgi:hypothetical protein